MNPDNGGGFWTVRDDDPDTTAVFPDQIAAQMRARVGDEAFGRIQRQVRNTRVLMRHPRPLTDEQAAVFREAVAPLLRDLRATGETLPDIREESRHDRGEDAICAWIQGPGQAGQGIDVWLTGTAAFQLYSLAEQFQSWKVDQLGPGSCWPRCREHAPDGGLMPDIDGAVAVWICPVSGQIIAPIGALRHADCPLRRNTTR